METLGQYMDWEGFYNTMGSVQIFRGLGNVALDPLSSDLERTNRFSAPSRGCSFGERSGSAFLQMQRKSENAQ